MNGESNITQSVSLIITVYNEADHLERLLSIIDELRLPVEKELVIVNDCSTDGSADIIKQFQFKSPVVFVEQHPNQWNGAAIRAGIGKATGTIIGIQDADMETDVN